VLLSGPLNTCRQVGIPFLIHLIHSPFLPYLLFDSHSDSLPHMCTLRFPVLVETDTILATLKIACIHNMMEAECHSDFMGFKHKCAIIMKKEVECHSAR
jgi:hypothetical protein